MKKIFRTLIPCLAMAAALTGCYDEMDDKAVIDAKHVLANTPSVTISSATADDYSSATVTGAISTVEGVVEAGFMVSTSSDFSGAKIYALDEVSSTLTTTLSGLAELTTYQVKAYAFLADDRIVYSEVASITTPQAPPLSAALLDGKTYTGTANGYWGDVYSSMSVTIVADETDENKVYVQNLDPYFASYGYVASSGYNVYEGVLDPETETITVASGQEVGYSDVVINSFNTNDPDTADGYGDVVITVVSKGAALKIANSFGVMSLSQGWWEIYYGGITLNVK